MKNKLLYDIRKLSCSYNGRSNKEVLSLKELKIYEKKLVVVLGISGVGKTTLLEALGMMNNTMNKDSIIHFYPSNSKIPGGHDSIDIRKLWLEGNENKISEIRKWYFSFIFQDTQLMPNLNIYENLRSLQIIQNKELPPDKLNALIEKFHLEDIDLNKNPNELSGGQKQRISFLNSTSSDYTVLFGDEPTGSLDQYNANIIMGFLKKEVKENDKSIIIVSHNLELALEYADHIIILSNESNDNISSSSNGNITFSNVQSIFLNEDRNWFADPGFTESLNKFEYNLEEYLTPARSSNSTTKNAVYPSVGKSKRFVQFLFFKEFRTLLSLRNLALSILLSVLSFWAISFANGKLDELYDQKSPVVMQMLVPIYRASSFKINESLNKMVNSNKYALSSYSCQYSFWLPFKDYKKLNEPGIINKSSSGRTIDIHKDSSLINYLFQGSKHNSSMLEESDFGVIVTKDLLGQLNYPDSFSCFIYMSTNGDDPLPYIPIPIKAIVDDIPGNLDFLCTNYFRNNYNNKNVFRSDQESKAVRFFIPSLTVDTSFLTKIITEEVQNRNRSLERLYYTPDTIDNDTIKLYTLEKGLRVDFRLDTLSTTYMLELYESIKSIWSVNQSQNSLYLDMRYNKKDPKANNKFDLVILNFKDFSKINDFEKDFSLVFKEYKIDTSVIKQKSAFQIVDTIASNLIWILIILSSLSLSFLFSNTLSNYLNNIRMNIGNYLAFGVKKRELRLLYLAINLTYLMVVLLFSFLLVVGINQVTGNLSPFKESTFYAFIGIICVTLLGTYFVLQNYLSKSPGDLIYKR